MATYNLVAGVLYSSYTPSWQNLHKSVMVNAIHFICLPIADSVQQFDSDEGNQPFSIVSKDSSSLLFIYSRPEPKTCKHLLKGTLCS